MNKKLTKHGNSLALVIDQPILKILNIDGTTELKITTDGHKIIIEPIKITKKKKVSRDSKMQQIMMNLLRSTALLLKSLQNSMHNIRFLTLPKIVPKL